MCVEHNIRRSSDLQNPHKLKAPLPGKGSLLPHACYKYKRKLFAVICVEGNLANPNKTAAPQRLLIASVLYVPRNVHATDPWHFQG